MKHNDNPWRQIGLEPNGIVTHMMEVANGVIIRTMYQHDMHRPEGGYSHTTCDTSMVFVPGGLMPEREPALEAPGMRCDHCNGLDRPNDQVMWYDGARANLHRDCYDPFQKKRRER